MSMGCELPPVHVQLIRVYATRENDIPSQVCLDSDLMLSIANKLTRQKRGQHPVAYFQIEWIAFN